MTKTVHETTNFSTLFSRKLESTLEKNAVESSILDINIQISQKYAVAYAEHQKLQNAGICKNRSRMFLTAMAVTHGLFLLSIEQTSHPL